MRERKRIKLSSSEPSLIAISDSLSSMTSELLEKSSVYVNLAMPPSSASKNIERRLPAYSWIDPQDHPASSEPFLNHSWYLPPQGSVKLEPEHDDSSNSQSLAPDADENSAYFQFFRSIFHDYKELVPRKQRLFRRQCLNYLHELLDESEEPLDHAINLSNSADTSGLDKCVIMKVEPCDNM